MSDWTASTNDEHWSGPFDMPSRESALKTLIDEHNVEPGRMVFVGRARPVDPNEMAAEISFNARESLDQWLYDNLGCDDGIDCTDEQEAELKAAIKRTVVEWFTRHDLVPKWHHVDHVEMVIVEKPASDAP